MANSEQLEILKRGVGVWNEWRLEKLTQTFKARKVDLRGADLNGADLVEADLSGADLSGANLREANLELANLGGGKLSDSDLRGANFEAACLRSADLIQAKLYAANLTGASLNDAVILAANLTETILTQTDFTGATLAKTTLADVDLTETNGLDKCRHAGPSYVDHLTLARSKNIPLVFWRGCGVPDALVEYMPSLTGIAIQFYSCFISYSSKDDEFAERLHADLQDRGVRCWFAPHDLPIGDKILDGIDHAIRVRDKVILILSGAAIASDWVEDEVATAFEEERRRGDTILLPIRLDNTVMETDEAWAAKLRARNIGDFTRWKEHDVYKARLDRILRNLRAKC